MKCSICNRLTTTVKVHNLEVCKNKEACFNALLGGHAKNFIPLPSPFTMGKTLNLGIETKLFKKRMALNLLERSTFRKAKKIEASFVFSHENQFDKAFRQVLLGK